MNIFKSIFYTSISLTIISCGGGGGSSNLPVLGDTIISQDPSSNVLSDEIEISGNVIDGYVSGAKVFVDENFNLTHDTGELSAITDDNGRYELDGALDRFVSLGYIETIEDSDEVNLLVDQSLLDDFYDCWKDRPLVADVPEGANDSQTGLVRDAYQMVLPASISRYVYGENILNITPFTNFLVDAVQDVVVSEGIELSLEQGCSDEGDEVQELISDRVDLLLTEFSNTYGISFNDLVSNFMEEIRNDKITPENAEIIVEWLPYFLDIKTQVGSEMSNTFEKDIYPMFAIEESSKNALIQGSDPDELAINFKSYFQGETNENGWYYTHSIRSWGANLNVQGEVIPFKCANGSASCVLTEYSLDDYYNASAYWMNRIDFINDVPITGHENKKVFISSEDENRWQDGATFTSDYQTYLDKTNYETLTRNCLKLDQFSFSIPQDDNDAENYYGLQYRYNFGYNNFNTTALNCRDLPDIEPLFIMFYVYPGSAQIQIYDPDFLINTIKKPFENRADLDPKPLLDEIDEMPKYFADFDDFRARLVELNKGEDRHYINFYNKDQKYMLRINQNPENDEFLIVQANTILSTGQEARNNFWEKLILDGLPEDLVGEVPQG